LLKINVVGGTLPYTFTFGGVSQSSDTFQLFNNTSPNQPGFVTDSDPYGRAQVATFTVTASLPTEIVAPVNPANIRISRASSATSSDGILVLWGYSPSGWHRAKLFSSSLIAECDPSFCHLAGLASGNYNLSITDSYGCQNTQVVTVDYFATPQTNGFTCFLDVFSQALRCNWSLSQYANVSTTSYSLQYAIGNVSANASIVFVDSGITSPNQPLAYDYGVVYSLQLVAINSAGTTTSQPNVIYANGARPRPSSHYLSNVGLCCRNYPSGAHWSTNNARY